MNLGYKTKDCCSPCETSTDSQSKTIYPSFTVNDVSELAEKLTSGQEVNATVTLKVISVESHTADNYRSKSGSCVQFQVTDMELSNKSKNAKETIRKILASLS